MSAAALKRGDTYDHDCARTTYRLGIARAILESLGITASVEHSKACAHLQQKCDYACKTTWAPAFVNDTPAIFQDAYNLADAFQTARGNANQRDASALRSKVAH